MSRGPFSMRRTALGVLAALALIASACGGGSDGAAVESSAAAADSSSDSQTEAEAPAAEAALVANTVDGGQIDFGSLEGQDVVLWFWAPW